MYRMAQITTEAHRFVKLVLISKCPHHLVFINLDETSQFLLWPVKLHSTCLVQILAKHTIVEAQLQKISWTSMAPGTETKEVTSHGPQVLLTFLRLRLSSWHRQIKPSDPRRCHLCPKGMEHLLKNWQPKDPWPVSQTYFNCKLVIRNI